MTEFKEIAIVNLVPAEWNYKTNGTDEQVQKLAESIKKDESAGVPVVRQVEGGKYEVVDGNHRLRALQSLGWPKVMCENRGKITLAEAITISRRRNAQWFPDDVLKYAELFRDNVLKEYSVEELSTFMPETKEQLEAQAKLLDFDWGQFDRPSDGDEFAVDTRLVLNLPKEVHNRWLAWKHSLEAGTNEKAFELLLGKIEVANE